MDFLGLADFGRTGPPREADHHLPIWVRAGGRAPDAGTIGPAIGGDQGASSPDSDAGFAKIEENCGPAKSGHPGNLNRCAALTFADILRAARPSHLQAQSGMLY